MSKLLQKAEAKFRRGKIKSAKEILRRMLAKRSNNGEALSLLGSIFLIEGNYETAVKYLAKAVGTDKAQPCWYANYANALQKFNSYTAAEKAYRLADLMGCTSFEFYTAYGRFLNHVKNDYQQAEIYFAKILAKDHKYYSAYIDLGNVYNAMGEYDKVIQVLEHCINLGYKDHALYSNLGLALSQQGRSKESLVYFEMAFESNPGYQIAISNYILNMLNVFDDQEYLYKKICELTSNLNLNAIETFTGDISTDKTKKLKLGFVSADFYNHAIANFISVILASIDKDQFSIHLYYNGHIQDHLTSAFFHLSDTWFNCADVKTDDLEQQIRDDGIDILLDLSHHTRGNRLDVFARKPAPIQINLMGLPISTGLKSIDYSFAAYHLIKQCELNKNSSEQVWPLPFEHVFAQVITPPLIDNPPFLKKGYITFGSFNGLRKISPTLIEVWSKILLRVANSKLWMVIHDEKNKDMQNYIYTLFKQCGVKRSRLILVGRMSLPKYLESHNEVDIALDAYPYTGCTTTYYTLLMGLPLVSCRGKSVASNESYSILSLLNKEKWVGDSLVEYADIAVKIANDPNQIISSKAGLRKEFQNSDIMKHHTYTKNLETAWREMWNRYCDEEG